MRTTCTVTFVVLTVSCGACAAADSDLPMCPNDGYISDRLVPNKGVAEAIYRAVGTALVPSNFKEFPIVIVNDEGDHWSVSQTSVPRTPDHPASDAQTETVMISAGGGQLNMDINKCTGAISHAALNR